MAERYTDESGLPSTLPVAGGKKDAMTNSSGASGLSPRQAADNDGKNGESSDDRETDTGAASEAGASTSGKGRRGGGAADEDAELQLKGNLEILSRLGEGASGEVKKALHRPTGLVMAHKVSFEEYCVEIFDEGELQADRFVASDHKHIAQS